MNLRYRIYDLRAHGANGGYGIFEGSGAGNILAGHRYEPYRHALRGMAMNDRSNNSRAFLNVSRIQHHGWAAWGFPFSRRGVAAKFAGVTGWLKQLEGAPKRFVAPLCILIITV